MRESQNPLFDRIEYLCMKRGKRIAHLCGETGISTGTIADLKTGRSTMLSVSNLVKIADALGVSVDELLGREV